MHTSRNPNQTPHYGLRRAGALLGVLALGSMIVAGGIEGHKAFERKQERVRYINHPEKMPEGSYDTITILPGDRAATIAQEYTDADHDWRNLATQIQNQATGKHETLQPGQTVHIWKQLETSHPENDQASN